MKEAAGEANMTVITIVLIGVIAAIAIPIVNNAMATTQRKSCCNNAGGVWSGNQCNGNQRVQTEYAACIQETSGAGE